MIEKANSVINPPNLSREVSSVVANVPSDKPAPPSLFKATSTMEKAGSEETTAANSKTKAAAADSFLRPPSPSAVT